MTPKAFLHETAPYLPIGPYTEIGVANDLQVIIRDELVRRTLFTDDAARLLIGAIVEEHGSIGYGVHIFPIDGRTKWQCTLYDTEAEIAAEAEGPSPLAAALSARQRAKGAK